MRRCAVSAAANIVEGSGRHSDREYLRYLEISFSSLRELSYYVDLAQELELLGPEEAESLKELQLSAVSQLGGLLKKLRSR